tara:strand:- start:815 stop:958 length:144 start_codon:yes stop_codon:yes gene_type:complete
MSNKEHVHLTLRPGYKDKLKRLAKKEGVSSGKVVENHLDKVKEIEND